MVLIKSLLTGQAFKKLSEKGSENSSNNGKSKADENRGMERATARVFVALTLHHRAKFSLSQNRIRLGRAAYHWGLLLMPEAPNDDCCAAFDVSDGPQPDPNTRADLNPNRDWIFRNKNPVSPVMIGSLIGRVIIGEMDSNTSVAEVGTLLRSLPLPAKDTGPPENCVTWTLNAVLALQSAGLAYAFDIEEFAEWALSYGDVCMDKPGNNICDYADVVSS
ncbi:hypothetical protein SEPCBS57363_006558 [Sporothrix epigloea]|uniref:Uncharacterized protein n=1 Tax=Sporothrix epigloea TaxID=1892477 RepID=A0ABP0E7Y8_9PEZI